MPWSPARSVAGMTVVRELTVTDVEWAVGVLRRRRETLVPFAPRLWRPADDADQRHAAFLAYVLGEGGGVGFRTDSSLIVATPGSDGWVVDDASVPDGEWTGEGVALWGRLAERLGSVRVRLVCPVPEEQRGAFARDAGLSPTTSWWHREVDRSHGTATDPVLPGAAVTLVPAPPIYDPGGPILFVRDVADAAAPLAAAAEAARCGSPLVVVEQLWGDQVLGTGLRRDGFVRHCDFLTGVLAVQPQGHPPASAPA